MKKFLTCIKVSLLGIIMLLSYSTIFARDIGTFVEGSGSGKKVIMVVPSMNINKKVYDSNIEMNMAMITGDIIHIDLITNSGRVLTQEALYYTYQRGSNDISNPILIHNMGVVSGKETMIKDGKVVSIGNYIIDNKLHQAIINRNNYNLFLKVKEDSYPLFIPVDTYAKHELAKVLLEHDQLTLNNKLRNLNEK